MVHQTDEKGFLPVWWKSRIHRLRKLVWIGMKESGSIIFEDETLFGYVFQKFREVASELTD